uniref:3',5'-cyclic-nucleotide phosphodiesterase n=2 Tax=Tetraselmis sp. GSL018 TaxID=582737 RepID=A0A061RJQ1_9CHLO
MLQVTFPADMPSNITFNATDVDDTDVFIQLKQRFKYGTAERSDGVTLSWGFNPTLLQNAAFIPPFDPRWGPAWSYQYSPCPCCRQQATCSLPGGGGSREQCNCSFSLYTADKILGGVTSFPDAGSSPTAFYINIPGNHFITVGLETPVYVTQIRVYETLTPGKIVNISGASDYRGNMTEWVQLYSGAAEDLPLQSVRMFNPALRPAPASSFGFLRLDISIEDTGADVSFFLDAIEVLGSIQPPAGMLLSDGVLRYTPTPGLHGHLEAIPFRAVDRGATGGEERILDIYVDRPANETSATTWGSLEPMSGLVGRATEVQVSLEEFRALAPKEVVGWPVVAVELISEQALPASVGVSSAGGGDDTTTTAVSEEGGLVASSEAGAFLVGHSGKSWEPEVPLQAWVTLSDNTTGVPANVTFRLRTQIVWVCPPDADPRDCASAASACLRLDGRWLWNEVETQRCEPSGSGAGLWFIWLVGAMAGLLLLVILGGGWLLWRLRKKTRVLSQKLREAETTFHPLEVDPDAPLTKLLTFLDELAAPKRRTWGVALLQLFGRTRLGDKVIGERAQELSAQLRGAANVYVPNLQQSMADASRATATTDVAAFLISMVQGSVTGQLGSETSLHNPDADLVEPFLSGPENWTAEEVLSAFQPSQGSLQIDLLGNLFVDPFKLESATGGRPLLNVALKAVVDLNLESLVNKGSMGHFMSFVAAMESTYTDVPYHNRVHAADVTARLCALLHRSGIRRHAEARKDRMAIFAALVAAVVHDAGHPGTNNGYHISKRTELAHSFNDQSVLENYSLNLAFTILRQHNFTQNWSTSEFLRFRKTVIAIVLATDFSHHFDHLSKFKAKVGSSQGDAVWDAIETQDHLLLLVMAMKVADLGHCAARLEVHVKWVSRLQEEFFLQGDKEREAYLPVSALMDRHKPGPASGVNQLGFFDVMVLPLLKEWCHAFPETSELLNQAEENRRYWEKDAKEDSDRRHSQGLGKKHSVEVDSLEP